MSNVIKAYSVRFEEEAAITIDTHLKRDSDINEKRNFRIAPAEEPCGFVEGIKAVVVEQLPTEAETQEKTAKILEDARREAKAILDKARLEAEQMKAEASALAKKTGYEDGLRQSATEYQKKLAELEQQKLKLSEEYQTRLAQLEPKTAGLLADLIEKLTGILVEEQRDVILYLVEKAFLELDKADSYTIRISKEDYELVAGRRDYLIGLSGREVTLYITEDSGLSKNQCLIETDLKVINCSLDVQLTNLINDLKLLGGL